MELERLQKYISRCGFASRRKAEELIVAGKVRVNGRTVTELGVKINPDVDRVKIDGERLEPERMEYYLLNKPKGVITSVTDPQGRSTVMDYLKGVKGRIYPVGRLDYHTEGLLLLTNDGTLAQGLMHPSHGVKKTYEVKLKGRVADEHLVQIGDGVPLEDGVTSPAELVDYGFDGKTGLTTVEITIHEGRNRQVRRMFEHYGYSIHNLKRLSYAGLTLAGVKRGAYRKLTMPEVRYLKDLAAGLVSEDDMPEANEDRKFDRYNKGTGKGSGYGARKREGFGPAPRREGFSGRGREERGERRGFGSGRNSESRGRGFEGRSERSGFGGRTSDNRGFGSRNGESRGAGRSGASRGGSSRGGSGRPAGAGRSTGRPTNRRGGNR